VSVFADRVSRPAPGLEGGGSGEPGVAKLGNGPELASKQTVEVQPGDDVVLITPGGGGFGRAQERDPGAVRDDVADGYVSHQQARDAYGVVINDDGSLDEASTTRLRRREGTTHR
jgi:N-methylhydantoinase B/oxoprolinase/acetone carboxylase alpha subunit